MKLFSSDWSTVGVVLEKNTIYSFTIDLLKDKVKVLKQLPMILTA